MKIIVQEEDYNGNKFRAILSDYTNKWFANYNFEIIGGGATAEDAVKNLKDKAKEMIEDINIVIYNPTL